MALEQDASEHSERSGLSQRSRRWTIGLVFLAIVVTLWVASGFMINAISIEYSKPCFITYCNTGTFIIYLLPSVWTKSARESCYRQLVVGSQPDEEESSRGSIFNDRSKPPNHAMIPFKETAILACQFAVLWFVSNLFNNLSYIYTTVASATILSCSSSFFTLLVGSVFGIEHFTLSKLGALVVSIVGIWMITIAGDTTESGPQSGMLGNIYALASAFLYGVYTTLLKVKVGDDESRLDVKLFLGFVGLFNLVALWPVLIVLNYSGVEIFGLPESSWIWSLLIINGISTLVSDFSWVLATLMTSPLVVTVGLSATIPISMLGDRIINGHYGTLLYYTGAVLVAWAFFAINKQEKDIDLFTSSNNDTDNEIEGNDSGNHHNVDEHLTLEI